MRLKNNLLIFIAVILVLFASYVSSISFLVSPNINNLTQSNQDVICYWSPSSDYTSATVNWYNGSSLVGLAKTTTSNNYTLLPTSYTKKGQTWICSVNITNGTSNLIVNKSIIIKNTPPSDFIIKNQSNNFNFGNQTTINEDETSVFTLNAFDYDSDSITYNIFESEYIGLVVDNTFTWTPEMEDIGIHNMSFYARDISNGITVIEFLLTVTEVNDNPIFVNFEDQILDEKEDLFYKVNVTDEESDYPINFRLVNNGGLPLQLDTLSNTSFNLSFFRPTNFSDVGNHTVTMEINDTRGGSTVSSINIEIKTINHKPNITYVESKSGIQNQPYNFTFNVSEEGADNETLTFSIIPIGNCPYNNPWTNIQIISNHSSNASAIIIIPSLNNTHLICNEINITAYDGKQTGWKNVTLNFTNINDAPTIYNLSGHPSNNIEDINNLIAYSQTNFIYYINATDIDYLINNSESWNYTLNNSNIPITTVSFNQQYMGLISFTPNQTLIGNHSLELTVTDNLGLSTKKNFTLVIYNNSVPYLNNTNLSFTCYESINCFINITENNEPIDLDNGEITITVNDSIMFPMTSEGVINKTFTQSEFGNYSLKLTLTDDKGAFIIYGMNMVIENVNDLPIIITENITKRMVATYPFNYQIISYDKDRDEDPEFQNQNVTFYSNDTTHFNMSSLGFISFTPTEGMIGNYSINVTVRDYTGGNTSKIFNITIYPKTANPIISNITPHSIPTNFTWLQVSPTDNLTYINISENTTITFNVSIIQSAIEKPAYYYWNYDGVNEIVGSLESHYTKYFNFAQGGIHNLTLVVNNSFYGSDTFKWQINVTNLNRAPYMVNAPPDASINQTVTDSFYLFGSSISKIFYDPDEDLDNNGVISISNINSDNEASNLVFAVHNISDPSVLDITFDKGKITFSPKATGITYVLFNITDGDKSYVMNESDYITYNITFTPEGNDIIVVPVPTTTKKKPSPVYYQVEVEKITNLDIITPLSATTYENNTVKIPIKLENNGNSTLERIALGAESNMTDLTYEFKNQVIDRLLPGSAFETELIVTSFNTQGSYEIVIYANVTNPKFSDKSIVLIGSIEKSKGDKTATNTKITFVADLLSSKTECLDLNEMIEEIKQELLTTQDYLKASAELDELIETCRYLSSSKTPNESKPNIINIDLDKFITNKPILYLIITIISSLFLSLGYAIYYSNKKID